MPVEPIEPLSESDLAELLSFIDEHGESDARYEIIGGELYVNPPPKPRHQSLLSEVAETLRAHRPEGWSIQPEYPVLVAGEHVVPDIAVFDHRPTPGDEQYLDESPRLVVEVESANNLRRDRIEKPAIYARAGLDAYWRVERNGTTHIYTGPRRDGTWQAVRTVQVGETLGVADPFEVEIEPAAWLYWV